MNKILIVEDDNTIHDMVKEYLNKRGFHCEHAYSGTEALLVQKQENCDLILMDLMLPGLDGKQALTKIKKEYDVPVIIVSAKNTIEDKVSLLAIGADDYITKPFALEELEARINVQLRKHYTDKDDGIIVQNLILYPDQRTFQIDDTKVSLTKHEYRIMELLMQYPKRAFSKKDIYEYAWDDIYAADDKTVSVHISNIRNKCKGRDIIETVWGIGFKLKLERE
ncbi:DNA-binding response regulator [Faecalitalea cylindroides]|uniref:DNA-binding response regulator n=1 Tax=Faecalitalea cylindroides TaxID=39483 RepID=A0A1Y4LNQ2_9FIRM|nr:response regulator transcription factor [Faecalitalea cylindroides]OUP58326.1 DNA-binding response regulator [Faecalitalea cylindroides]